MATTNLLILGSDIREQVWASKLRLSPQVGELFCLPASEGMAPFAQACSLPMTDYDAIAQFCKDRNIQWVLAFQPVLCYSDIVQYLKQQQIRVIAADVEAADVETASGKILELVGSRVAWQKLMRQHGVPIPASHFLDNMDGVILLAEQATMPIVIKTDTIDNAKMGVCNCLKDVEDYLSTHIKNTGDNADERIVLENFIQAPIVCVPVLVTGKNIWTAPYCQLLQSDHHIVGGCLPAPMDAKVERTLERVVIVPWLHAFKEYLSEYLGVKNYQGMFSLEVAITHKGPYLVDVKMGWDGLITALVLSNLASDAYVLLQAFADGFPNSDEQEALSHKKSAAKEAAHKKNAKETSLQQYAVAEWKTATAAFCVPTPTEFKLGAQEQVPGKTIGSDIRIFQEKSRETMPGKNASLVCIVHNAESVPKAAQKIADYWTEKRWLPSVALKEALAQATAQPKNF